MAGEVQGARRFLIAKLRARAQLNALVTGFHNDVGPPSAAHPFVVVAHHAGRDVNAIGAIRVMTTLLFHIKVVCKGWDLAPAEQIEREIDAALMGQSGQVTDPPVFVMGCYRETPVRSVELAPEGQRFDHVGGLYRLIVYSTA